MNLDLERHRVGEAFRSRKNRVFRVRTDGRIRVAKVYPTSGTESARAEFELLTRCVGLRLKVPAPIELSDRAIVMTYLEGTPVADLVDPILPSGDASRGQEQASLVSLSTGLANWLATFHRAFDFGLCRGDTILRNFLLSNDEVYGLDFEEAHRGDPIQDLGELCANVLGMRPLCGTVNFEFASNVANSYWKAVGESRMGDLAEAVALGLEHYAAYRKDGAVLREWACRFRKEGPGFLGMLLRRA